MYFFNLGPRALEMLRAPRYLNPAVAGLRQLCVVTVPFHSLHYMNWIDSHS